MREPYYTCCEDGMLSQVPPTDRSGLCPKCHREADAVGAALKKVVDDHMAEHTAPSSEAHQWEDADDLTLARAEVLSLVGLLAELDRMEQENNDDALGGYCGAKVADFKRRYREAIARNGDVSPLSPERVHELWTAALAEGPEATTPMRFARAIERAHGVGLPDGSQR